MSTTTKRPDKFVYFFAAGQADGNAGMKNILGGKGANLAEMTALNIPVPPGFTISTEICTLFYENNEQIPEWVRPVVLENLARVEKLVGKKFGDTTNPLLFSVRSGSRASMPGMMDTILNLGLNDDTVQGIIKLTNNPRFAWDSYRRFLMMYSNVVMDMHREKLEHTIDDLKKKKGIKYDTEMTVEDLQFLVKRFKEQIKEDTKHDFPMNVQDQLWGAITAVFQSWNTPRAVKYRELNNLPNSWGTAVNVQSMVFGNMGDDSATGVAFTRNPSTGEKRFFGEFLVNAQGEDVVAGIRTPQPVTKYAAQGTGLKSLEEVMPKAYSELEGIYNKLEQHYRDMQDIEFTIEKGKLWMLQTRNAKRTARASLKVAIDMLNEGMISEDEAVLRVSPSSLEQLMHPALDPNVKKTLLAKGLPASPGGVSGHVVFTPEDAVAWKEKGKKTILCRVETSPEDIAGMVAAQGILTARGGMTSHAAVVARGMGKCCVAGCSEIEISYKTKTMTTKTQTIKEGDVITLDGSAGHVYLGEIKTIPPQLDEYFEKLMKIADQKRRLKVRTNADTPKDADQARKYGAEGIGLCRTEHMFFGADRIDAVREMILADTLEDREKALAKLLPMQREDFIGLFKIMQGFPVTIRLLDPPLHEFIPQDDKDMLELSKRLHVDADKLRHRAHQLHEFNPMLGHRGCRLAVTYPEIYKMQVRAIAEAACSIVKSGSTLIPEIMHPLVATRQEIDFLRKLTIEIVEKVQKEQGVKFEYLVGTMIELPRAAITADQIAEHADFFSYGTNDLTQTALGLSRDDAGRFLPSYVSSGIFERDPFVTIDQEGVGALVRMGVEKGRKTKPKLKIGICGEHGGDPDSVEFFHSANLDYVSCSPFRVPIARLAAAQAALKDKKK